MAAWLREKKATPRAYARFWRPLLVSALNEEPERSSALPALQVFDEGLLGAAQAMKSAYRRFLSPNFIRLRWSGASGRACASISARASNASIPPRRSGLFHQRGSVRARRSAAARPVSGHRELRALADHGNSLVVRPSAHRARPCDPPRPPAAMALPQERDLLPGRGQRFAGHGGHDAGGNRRDGAKRTRGVFPRRRRRGAGTLARGQGDSRDLFRETRPGGRPVPPRAPATPTCSSPAIGPTPGCRQRWKAPCAAVTPPPKPSSPRPPRVDPLPAGKGFLALRLPA